MVIFASDYSFGVTIFLLKSIFLILATSKAKMVLIFTEIPGWSSSTQCSSVQVYCYLPAQFVPVSPPTILPGCIPFPEYPTPHVQLYEATVLVHCPPLFADAHWWDWSVHSSISDWRKIRRCLTEMCAYRFRTWSSNTECDQMKGSFWNSL